MKTVSDARVNSCTNRERCRLSGDTHSEKPGPARYGPRRVEAINAVTDDMKWVTKAGDLQWPRV